MKKYIFWIIFSLILPATAFGDLDWVPFTVTRHVNTTSLTNTAIDNIMTDANNRMKYDNQDCTVDVPCTVRFYRSGNVGIFGSASDGLDVIDNQDELDDVFAVNSHRVKIVDDVNYCAGGYNTSIIGCGKCDAFGYILEDWVAGNVYVHEYGHNVLGCGHRDDCAYNIMNTYSNGDNNAVNSSECSGYGGSAYTQLCGNVYDGSGGPLTAGGGPYWITCTVTIPAGRTLTISAGTEIQFEQGTKIISSGTTNADGSTSSITLYSNNESRGFPTMIVNKEIVIQNGGGIRLE